jgi:hypothetical protein
MGFLRNLFDKKQTADKQSNEEPEQPAPSGPTPKQVQGVLILTRRPMAESFTLHEQIIALQRSKGYSISLNCISKAAVTEKIDDEAFLHETIRKHFAKLGGDDLIERTEVVPCQATGGNTGIYCVIFDRP